MTVDLRKGYRKGKDKRNQAVPLYIHINFNKLHVLSRYIFSKYTRVPYLTNPIFSTEYPCQYTKATGPADEGGKLENNHRSNYGLRVLQMFLNPDTTTPGSCHRCVYTTEDPRGFTTNALQ